MTDTITKDGIAIRVIPSASPRNTIPYYTVRWAVERDGKVRKASNGTTSWATAKGWYERHPGATVEQGFIAGFA